MRTIFSIRGLMVSVVYVAIGMAALRDPSEFVTRALFNLTFVILLSGLLLIFYRRGQERTFWVGFLLFGSSYLTLYLGFRDSSLSKLTNLTDYLFAHLHPQEQGTSFRWETRFMHSRFKIVSLSLGTMVFALIGGIVGNILTTLTKCPEEPPADSSHESD